MTTTTIHLTISNDLMALGDHATPDDLRAYCAQLGRELGAQHGCTVVVQSGAVERPTVAEHDDLAEAVEATCREWHQSDVWSAVLKRSLSETTHEEECAYCGRIVRARAEVPGVASFEWRTMGPEHSVTCEWIATRAHRLDAPSDTALEALRAEAAAAGDDKQVSLCDRALAGEATAIALCALALRAAAAMA